MNKLLTKNFFYYLSLLLPLTYAVGVFVTELFLILVILFFLIKNRDINYFRDKKFILFLLISFYFALSALIQIDDNLKISSLFHFRYIIFSLSILFCLNYFEHNKINLRKNVLFLFFFVISLVIFDAFFQFLSGENLLGFKIIKNRISGFFGEELVLGSFLIKMLPILTWLLFYSNFDVKNNQRNLIIFFSLYIICIYLSGERSSFGLALIYFSLIVLFIKPLRKVFLIPIPVLIILIFTIFYFELGKTMPSKRMFVKTFHQMTNQFIFKDNVESKELLNIDPDKNKNTIKEKLLIFSNDHTGHFHLAYELFKKNPIFGVGPKGFRHYCRDVSYDPPIGICSTHPHNFLVQITSETGLIGLFLYCFLLFLIIFKFFKTQNINVSEENKLSLRIISIGILVNLFPFLPSGNFFNNWISIINYYFLGLYLYSYSKVYFK